MASGGQGHPEESDDLGDLSRIYFKAKFPYFARCRLNLRIQSEPWQAVSDGCEIGDANCKQKAQQLYSTVLADMEAYIDHCKQNPETFGTDADAFVKEIAECLNREKETVFLSQKNQCPNYQVMTSDQLVQPAVTMNDHNLQSLEKTFQIAKAKIEEFNLFIEGQFGQPQPGIDCLGLNPLAQQLQTDAIDCLENTVKQLHAVTKDLNVYLKDWKNANARSVVEVGPRVQEDDLNLRFDKFAYVLSTTSEWFADNGFLRHLREADQESAFSDSLGIPEPSKIPQIDRNLQDVVRNFFSFNIMVTKEPECPLNVEGKKKDDKKEDSGANGNERKLNTKKTKSFSSSVRILGACHFPQLSVSSTHMDLVRESDLAQHRSGDNEECLDWNPTTQLPIVEFANISLQNFKRGDTKDVYMKFFRIRYTVVVWLPFLQGEKARLQVLSLPFTMITGSNQKTEHMGSRLWYIANSTDMYEGSFTLPNDLPVLNVIDMLDRFVTQTTGRDLRDDEKAFLRSRLQIHDGKVKFRDYIKATVSDTTAKEPPTFNTWFFSVIYSIRHLWKNLWRDRLIYGFCSRRHLEQLLQDSSLPVGTVMLRPSMSSVESKNSRDARAALLCIFKFKNPVPGTADQSCTKFFPFEYDQLEKSGLYSLLIKILYNGKRVAKFLLGYERYGKIDILEQVAFGTKIQMDPNYPRELFFKRVPETIITDQGPPEAYRTRKSETEDPDDKDAGSKKTKKASKTKTDRKEAIPGPSTVDDSSTSSSGLMFPMNSAGGTFCSQQIIKSDPDEVESSSAQARKGRSKKSSKTGQPSSASVTSKAALKKKNSSKYELQLGECQVDVSNYVNFQRSAGFPVPDVGSEVAVTSSSPLAPDSSPEGSVSYDFDSGRSSMSPSANFNMDSNSLSNINQAFQHAANVANGLFSGNAIMPPNASSFDIQNICSQENIATFQDKPMNAFQGDRQIHSQMPFPNSAIPGLPHSLPTVLFDTKEPTEGSWKSRVRGGKNRMRKESHSTIAEDKGQKIMTLLKPAQSVSDGEQITDQDILTLIVESFSIEQRGFPEQGDISSTSPEDSGYLGTPSPKDNHTHPFAHLSM